VEDNIELDFRNQVVVINGTEDFQYRPMLSSGMKSLVHCTMYVRVVGLLPGTLPVNQRDNYLVHCLIRYVDNLHLVP
jgi:hypothetical protein